MQKTKQPLKHTSPTQERPVEMQEVAEALGIDSGTPLRINKHFLGQGST